jgi:hypothetical protein
LKYSYKPAAEPPAVFAGTMLDGLDSELDKLTKGKEPGKVRIILD